MGRVQMWIDMFPMDLTMPGEPVNIAVRKPLEYELRVVIWNTEDVLPDETNALTGESSSDIFIKGWLEGNREDIQVFKYFSAASLIPYRQKMIGLENSRPNF